MELANRHNLNRGYMRLNVWNDAVGLFRFTSSSLNEIRKLDFKLKSQTLDAVQPISSNIAGGYCRQSLKEYLQFLYIASGSRSEGMTRMVSLKEAGQLDRKVFDKFDELHHATENKLLALVKSLQAELKDNNWNEKLEAAQTSL